MRARSQAQRITLAAVCASMVFLGTFWIRINSPIGIMHVGDGVIFMVAAVLDPVSAMFAAAIGSALANLAGAGGPIFIPATLISKGLLAYFAAVAIRRIKNHAALVGAFFALQFVLVLCLYFVYQAFIFSPAAAIGHLVPFAILQNLLGVTLGAIVVPVMKKINLNLENYYDNG
ncbi:MAG: ECF transporter S component [Oscillospiraceae bacterium]|nr:ECF transporter S component [Oscillospiraceae bacterium]